METVGPRRRDRAASRCTKGCNALPSPRGHTCVRENDCVKGSGLDGYKPRQLLEWRHNGPDTIESDSRDWGLEILRNDVWVAGRALSAVRAMTERLWMTRQTSANRTDPASPAKVRLLVRRRQCGPEPSIPSPRPSTWKPSRSVSDWRWRCALTASLRL